MPRGVLEYILGLSFMMASQSQREKLPYRAGRSVSDVRILKCPCSASYRRWGKVRRPVQELVLVPCRAGSLRREDCVDRSGPSRLAPEIKVEGHEAQENDEIFQIRQTVR